MQQQPCHHQIKEVLIIAVAVVGITLLTTQIPLIQLRFTPQKITGMFYHHTNFIQNMEEGNEIIQ
jgi:hypothetical protein